MLAFQAVCRVCGCTDDDCTQCVEAQGEPCAWVEADLCSRCAVDELGDCEFCPNPATKEGMTAIDVDGSGDGEPEHVTVCDADAWRLIA